MSDQPIDAGEIRALDGQPPDERQALLDLLLSKLSDGDILYLLENTGQLLDARHTDATILKRDEFLNGELLEYAYRVHKRLISLERRRPPEKRGTPCPVCGDVVEDVIDVDESQEIYFSLRKVQEGCDFGASTLAFVICCSCESLLADT